MLINCTYNKEEVSGVTKKTKTESPLGEEKDKFVVRNRPCIHSSACFLADI